MSSNFYIRGVDYKGKMMVEGSKFSMSTFEPTLFLDFVVYYHKVMSSWKDIAKTHFALLTIQS